MHPAASPDSVTDLPTFLEFVRHLTAERVAAVRAEQARASHPAGPDAGGWENTSIEAFLEAATSWAEATNMGLTQGLSPDNPWKQFAVFLYCGKIYE
jgi:hypothetical protein